MPHSEIRMKNVGLNPTRTGLLHILRSMGANITIENEHQEGAEPCGDIIVRSAQLRKIDLDPALIPNCIDELPILSIAMMYAKEPPSSLEQKNSATKKPIELWRSPSY